MEIKQRKLVYNFKWHKYVLSVFIFCCLSCSSKKNLDFYTGAINLELSNIDKVEYDTLNPYFGKYIFNEVDTFYYNVGFNISDLSESCPNVIWVYDTLMIDDFNQEDKSIIYTLNQHFDIDRYKKQNVIFNRISNKPIKYTFPIDTSKAGLVGVFVDSLFVHNIHGVLKFNIYCNSLSSLKYQTFLNDVLKMEIYPIDTALLALPIGNHYIQ